VRMRVVLPAPRNPPTTARMGLRLEFICQNDDLIVAEGDNHATAPRLVELLHRMLCRPSYSGRECADRRNHRRDDTYPFSCREL